MRRFIIVLAAIGILCRAYLDRWRRSVTGIPLLSPTEFWRLHRPALLKALELERELEVEPRVYLSPEGIFVRLGRDAAHLILPSSEGTEQIRLSFSKVGDIAERGILACRNQDLFEMSVGDFSLQVDARIRPAPATIFQKASDMMLGLTPERLVFKASSGSIWQYHALDRDSFAAGLKELSSLLALLPRLDEPQQVAARNHGDSAPHDA